MFREEKKLKEEEKRKREEKTDDAVPTVLGQVGHSCCEKCGLCQNHFEMLGNESLLLKVPVVVMSMLFAALAKRSHSG